MGESSHNARRAAKRRECRTRRMWDSVCRARQGVGGARQQGPMARCPPRSSPQRGGRKKQPRYTKTPRVRCFMTWLPMSHDIVDPAGVSTNRVIVEAVLAGQSHGAVARQYGISKVWVGKLVVRWLEGGWDAVEKRTTPAEGELPNPASAPSAPTSGSKRTGRTSAGRPTSPTSPSRTAPSSRCCASSTTADGAH